MIYKNYKNGQEVVITELCVKAKVLSHDFLYQEVIIETLEDYISPTDGLLTKAGLQSRIPESAIKPFVLN